LSIAELKQVIGKPFLALPLHRYSRSPPGSDENVPEMVARMTAVPNLIRSAEKLTVDI